MFYYVLVDKVEAVADDERVAIDESVDKIDERVDDKVGWLFVNVSMQVDINGDLPSPQNWPLKSSKLVSQVKAPPILLANTQLH